MGDHDALGPPGAAGGKDDIGEVLAVDAHAGVLRLDSRERFGERIEGDDQGRAFRKPAAQMVLGHQHGRPGIPEHRRESLRGMVGVERQVRPARLQDAQQTDDSGRPPVEVKTHDGLWPHTELEQAMGQRIGQPV